MHLFGYLDVPSFVKISLSDWIVHVNRMDCKRKVSHVFNYNPQGSRLKRTPKNRWWNCVKTDHDKC